MGFATVSKLKHHHISCPLLHGTIMRNAWMPRSSTACICGAMSLAERALATLVHELSQLEVTMTLQGHFTNPLCLAFGELGPTA